MAGQTEFIVNEFYIVSYTVCKTVLTSDRETYDCEM